MAPTLFLMVGLPGAGKTTRARSIESDHPALRLTPDEWILALYGDSLDRPARDAVRAPVEQLQWAVAARVLELGQSVVLDWGFWSAVEREEMRHQANALGASSEIVFVDEERELLWRRIASRPESAGGTLGITHAEFEAWADSFEPPSPSELGAV